MTAPTVRPTETEIKPLHPWRVPQVGIFDPDRFTGATEGADCDLDTLRVTAFWLRGSAKRGYSKREIGSETWARILEAALDRIDRLEGRTTDHQDVAA